MHVSVTSPFNYKRTHSVLLLATCKNKCSLTLVDVADPRQNSESCIISNSRICGAIIKNQLSLPELVEIYGSGKACNVFIGDERFQPCDFAL